MTTSHLNPETFQPVGEVVADDRSRITFGKAGVPANSRYAVSVNPDGAILLVPLASIPARELIVFQNAELNASLFRGLADAAEGRVGPVDWLDEVDVSGSDD